MAWKWYDSKLVRIEEAAPGVRRFWLALPPEDALRFSAGQFVTMDLPIHEKRLKRWRSYSIASAPSDGQLLEFCIVRLDGGLASAYFFDQVQEGDTIRFKGPDGNFVLPADLEEREMVWVATGTGVAPFRSMLLDLVERDIAFRHIHLIFGTRNREGMLYREEFEALARRLPNFRYSVALSRDAYPGVVTGYVHKLYLEEYAEPRPDLHFYLCGWSNMIDDAVANLVVQLGYDKSRVHYELYG
jgi:CDP-4-dehydro-6-deoxyglucose reductase